LRLFLRVFAYLRQPVLWAKFYFRVAPKTLTKVMHSSCTGELPFFISRAISRHFLKIPFNGKTARRLTLPLPFGVLVYVTALLGAAGRATH
jgi:hypothetical protein